MLVSTLLATFALVLAVGVAVAFRLRARRMDLSEEPDAAWDAEAERKRWLAMAAGLREVYRKLGFDPEVEADCERILRLLKGLIRVELPDYPAFRESLERIRAARAEPGAPELDQNDEALLQEVFSAWDEPRRVIEILERDPMDALLPFVERIPLHRDGELVWKTPMEVQLIVKRPADLDRFRERLDELARRIRRAKLRRKEALREGALTAVAALRRDLKRERAYLPTSMRQLETKLGDWLVPESGTRAADRRAELDGLLRRVLELRHRFGETVASGARLPPADRDEFQESAREQAQRYLEAPWMHADALTTVILGNLLDAELAPVASDRLRRRRAKPPPLLRLVSSEVHSGHYDSEENIRRLRRVEGDGVFVHSLNYALFRLSMGMGMGMGMRSQDLVKGASGGRGDI